MDERPQSVEEAHQLAMERGADCKSCPLYGARNGPVLNEVVPHGELVVIGAHPSSAEVGSGFLWFGDSDRWSGVPKPTRTGEFIKGALEHGGVSRRETSVLNACACAPEGGVYKAYNDRTKRAHKKREEVRVEAHHGELKPKERKKLMEDYLDPITCCRGMFQNDLRDAGGKVLLPLGEDAMKATAREYKVSVGKKKKNLAGELMLSAKLDEQHGHPLQLPDEKILLPTYGLYTIEKQNHLRHVVREDITTAAKIARRGYIDWTEPAYITFAPDALKTEEGRNTVLQTCVEWCKDAVRNTTAVMCDIETKPVEKFSLAADIRCIGFGQMRSGVESIIVIPTKWMDGAHIWNKQERATLAYAIRRVLDTLPIEFQNGQFDTARLLYRGLMTDRAKSWDDSMIAHHDSRENDAPHSLAFISSRFLEVPLWKTDVDHKATENVERDADLWLYNARDVYIQMKCMQGLRGWIERDRTEQQYNVDKKLLPIVRNMEELGVFVDLDLQSDLRKKCKVLYAERLEQLQEIVGSSDFNPRSSHQRKKWFYETKGYHAQLNTGGRKFEEDDSEGTGIPALQALQDHGAIDEETDKFINTYIKFSQVSTLLSKYLSPEHIQPSEWDGIGRLHPYTTLSIPTGRLATKPNIQNWPSRAEFNMKNMMIAPPGHVFVGGDFASLEVRTFVAETGDKYTLRALMNDLDPHTWFTAIIFSDDEADIEPRYWELKALEERGLAGDKKAMEKYNNSRKCGKFARLALQYGAQVEKVHGELMRMRDKKTSLRIFDSLPRKEVAAWVERHRKFCPEGPQWMRDVTSEVQRQGWVQEMFHKRIRHFPGGPSKKNAPGNMKNQGCAGGIVNESMIKINDAIPYQSWSPYTGISIQIHDDIRVIIPEDRAEEAKEIITEHTTYVLKGIPIYAEIEICDRLG